MLDKFAIEITRANVGHKILKVCQHHLGNYQTINNDFFTLFNQKQNFVDLYRNENIDKITT